jgi:hypothetical protein
MLHLFGNDRQLNLPMNTNDIRDMGGFSSGNLWEKVSENYFHRSSAVICYE